MSSNDYFGWDLLHKIIEKDIKSESDILIGVLHWYLLRKLSFLCVGIGDDKTLGENENGSEFLPENWNINKEHYSLRYVNNKKLYLLKGVTNDDDIILNFLEPQSRFVSNATINLKDTIKSLNGRLIKIIPNIDDLLKYIDNELFKPVLSGRTKEQCTQTTNLEHFGSNIDIDIIDNINNIDNIDNIDNIEIDIHINPDYIIPLLDINPQIDNPLRNIGRGDLDPFGRRGGMIFPDRGNNLLQIPRPSRPRLRRNNREPNPDNDDVDR